MQVSKLGFGCMGLSGIFNAPKISICVTDRPIVMELVGFTKAIQHPCDTCSQKINLPMKLLIHIYLSFYLDLLSYLILNTMGKLKKLVEEGKVKYVGLS
ncbi:unnamed protein product [Musa acuminata subsp. burmannicoides]